MIKIGSAKGLSLVEVLISIIIMGIIVGSMFPFFVRIQQKQVLASNVSVLFQGALASFETRRLHTLSRNYDADYTASRFNSTTGVPSSALNGPAGMSLQSGCLFESLRNEAGYYAMSAQEVMPFALGHSINGPNIDWIYGSFITCNNTAQNTTYSRSERVPVYSTARVLGFHRVFFFRSEVVCLVSLTQTEANARLNSNNFISDNSNAVVIAANTTGFGRHRNAFVFSPNGSSGLSNSATVNIGSTNPTLFRGVPRVITARNTLVNLANNTFTDRRLFRIVTHHISGIYEWPSENTGHV